ncbi:hypothetical protein A311_03767 [Escherichia coli KTE146]|uniref:hypothetical protein n=1 Tax=Escherichia coli TaxID=562 RepID=UPI0002A306D5|nr:hypothetical protein [Escherichia coli]ELG86363.1 hypothetical protein A311_03767 [Escherichia coli KTE146]
MFAFINTKQFIKGWAECFALLFMGCHSSWAGIQVSPMTVVLDTHNQYVSGIKVLSDSQEVQYIKVDIKKIENPGTPEQKDVDINDESSAIIASPQRFILPAGGRHVVRLLSNGIPSTEGVWRVYVHSVSDDDQDMVSKNNDAKIAININWGVLVYNEPENPEPKLSFNPTTGLLKNAGNTRIFITRYGFCNNANNCQWQNFGYAIYPNTAKHINNKNGRKENILLIESRKGNAAPKYTKVRF